MHDIINLTGDDNLLHFEVEDDACRTCGGQECITNPDYLVWEVGVSYFLSINILLDQRRHGLPAERREWDELVGAPPRYLPCPKCHSLDALDVRVKKQ